MASKSDYSTAHNINDRVWKIPYFQCRIEGTKGDRVVYADGSCLSFVRDGYHIHPVGGVCVNCFEYNCFLDAGYNVLGRVEVKWTMETDTHLVSFDGPATWKRAVHLLCMLASISGGRDGQPPTPAATFFPGVLLRPCGTRYCKSDLYKAGSSTAWMEKIQRPLPPIPKLESAVVEEEVIDLAAAAMADDLLDMNKALKALEIDGETDIYD